MNKVKLKGALNAAREKCSQLNGRLPRCLIEKKARNSSVSNYLFKGLTRCAHQIDKHFFTRRWHREVFRGVNKSQHQAETNIKHCSVNLMSFTAPHLFMLAIDGLSSLKYPRFRVPWSLLRAAIYAPVSFCSTSNEMTARIFLPRNLNSSELKMRSESPDKDNRSNVTMRAHCI